MKKIIIYLAALIVVVALSFTGRHFIHGAIAAEEEKIDDLNKTYSEYMEEYVKIDEYANYAAQFKTGLKNINDKLEGKNVLINEE